MIFQKVVFISIKINDSDSFIKLGDISERRSPIKYLNVRSIVSFFLFFLKMAFLFTFHAGLWSMCKHWLFSSPNRIEKKNWHCFNNFLFILEINEAEERE